MNQNQRDANAACSRFYVYSRVIGKSINGSVHVDELDFSIRIAIYYYYTYSHVFLLFTYKFSRYTRELIVRIKPGDKNLY